MFSAHTSKSISFDRRRFSVHVVVVCCVVLSLIVPWQVLQSDRPSSVQVNASAPSEITRTSNTDSRADHDGRNLPADLASAQEIVERRTANTATFHVSDGHR